MAEKRKKSNFSKQELRAHLENLFANQPLIGRHDQNLTVIVSPGTLANRDSAAAKEGLPGLKRVMIAGKTFYERKSLIEDLIARSDAE